MWEARADLEQELHVDSQSLVGIVDLDGDGHLDALSSDPERLMRWGTGPGSFGESNSMSPARLTQQPGLFKVWI